MDREKVKQRIYVSKLQKLAYINKKLYWAKKYHRSTRNERMTFEKAPFLISVYEALEHCRRLCVIKSVQSFISEAMIVSHLEEASRGLSILYVLPKGEARNTFVQNRINRIIQRVPFYRSMINSIVQDAKADSVHIKVFGKGVIKYVDSNSQSNFVEFPADAVYLDEKDQMNQVNIEMAPDRLTASPWRLEREVANPSVEDFGIDARWKESSQGVWHIKCDSCGEWQHPNWFEHVVRETGDRQYEVRDKGWRSGEKQEPDIYCRKCEKPLHRFAYGEYVHSFPKKDWKGLHINKLFGSPQTTVDELVRKFMRALSNDTRLQIFFNSDLGLPYSSAQSRIGESDLNACMVSDYYEPKSNESGIVVMGIDVGTLLNVIIRKITVVGGEERKQLMYAGAVKKKEEIVALIKRYGVKLAVIDALPETRLVESLQEIIPFMYKCFFGKSKNPQLDKKTKTLTVNRTTIIDEVKENVDDRSYANFANMRDNKDYYEHMQSNTRVYDSSSNEFNWVQSTKADHYLLAEVYCLLGLKLKISSNIFEFYEKAVGRTEDGIEKSPPTKTQGQVINDIVNSFYGQKKAK